MRDYAGALSSAITIGVSACLLGEKVRYDGSHKHDHYLTDVLGRYVRFLPVCPEVDCGMPVPREAMHLEGDPAAPRLVTRNSRRDLTAQMAAWCEATVAALAGEGLCGFIFKKDSPSSGLYRVKVYGVGGMPAKTGSGLFAAGVARHFPLLPLEEEGRLHDAALRENFLARVFAYARWRELRAAPAALGELVAFHSRHKLQLMAHSPEHYRELGVLVARGRDFPWPELVARYEERFMAALARHATLSKNCNVLHHLLGYFKKQLAGAEKREMLELIEEYRRGVVPLLVPLTLLKHYINKYDAPYLRQQTYLSPHPAELMLRNHV